MKAGRLALVILFVAIVCALPAAVRAHELRLEPLTCTGGAQSASKAIELAPAALDCSADRFDQRARFVRTHTDLGEAVLPPGERLVWQTDPSSFDSMVLRFTFDDGSERIVDVDPQMAVRNWFARTRFSVPVPVAEAQLVAIDTIIERPRTLATAREARLVESPHAASEHLIRSIVYALICGILIVPIIYDLLFYRVLRARFMLWHVGMTFGLLLFALSNSGLVFVFAPNLPLEIRFQLNTASLAVAVVSAVMFVLGILEDDTYPQWLGKLLIGLSALMVAVKIVSLIDIEAIRLVVHQLYLLSLIPIALALLVVILWTLRNGSRAAGFLVIAFLGMTIAGLVRLLSGTGWTDAAMATDDVTFAALVVLVIGTSAAVGDRFLIIRAERDRARSQALRLGRLAHTDGLTGLANRRAFDRLGRVNPARALLVGDIDRFKAINDSKGHTVGDAVLCHAAAVLRDCFRDSPDAEIFRLGGEEFAVVLDCEDAQRLAEWGERLRRAIETQGGKDADLPQITISVGGAMGAGRSIGEVFVDADGALFRAKGEGRNRCCIVGLDQPCAAETPS